MSTTPASAWNLDASHSSVTFSVRHMMTSNVRGEIQKIAGTVTFDPGAPATTAIEATLEVASINTREAQRDAHLRSADFLDAEKWPTITFRSRSVEKHGDGLRVTGDLTIRDTTKEVVLEVEAPTAPHKDPWGNTRIGASATTRIKRSDFGITWNAVLEAGGVLVGDEISITIDASLVAKA